MQPIHTDSPFLFDAVPFKKLDHRALTPEFQTRGSAGFDLAVIEDTFVPFGQTVMGRTGLVIAAPRGHMLLLAPRSSTWRKWEVRLGNTVGIVDEDYCGEEDELLLALWNPRKPDGTSRGTLIPGGTRIAQGIFVPVHNQVVFDERLVMGESRGGWGSTG